MSEQNDRVRRKPLSDVARRRRDADSDLFVPTPQQEPENPGSQVPENPSTQVPIPSEATKPTTRAARGVIQRKYILPRHLVERVDKLHAALFMARPNQDAIEKSEIVSAALEQAFDNTDEFRKTILDRHQRKNPGT